MADMLSLSIAIGPDDEIASVSSLVSEVFRYGLLVLRLIQVNPVTS